jgi:DNA polymerase (family 10)
LLAYSSKFGSGIGLRVVAKKKGFKLSQHGLFKGKKRIAGKTEEEIYHALGREWKRPEER